MSNFKNLEYPYIKYIKSSNTTDIFELVDNFKPKIYKKIPKIIKSAKSEQFEYFYKGYCFIEEDWQQNNRINSITDLFTENIRVKCEFLNKKSPLTYWKTSKDQIIKKTYQVYKKVTIENIREIIYQNTKLCNNFRITLSLCVLKLFKPSKWLDISAGWGDRLLSAIFYNYMYPTQFKLYHATDPNLDLHPLYDKIIDQLAPSDRSKFIIKPTGFENSPAPSDDFDIVFSSPPFFDLEKYSEHSDDSLTKYSTEDTWSNNFLLPTLIKSYNSLRKGGHLILYINTPNYVKIQLDKLHKHMKYKGIIYSYDRDDKRLTLRKMFVWKKHRSGKINNL